MAKTSYWTSILCALLFTLVLPYGPAHGADTKAAATTTDEDDSPVEPGALEALERMSASLQKLNSFALHADATNELALVDGQKLQFEGKVDIKAQRPDKFVVNMRSDHKSRDIYYDGKTVTVYAPRLKFYGVFKAPSTIGATIDKARADFGVEIPLADLFYFGKDDKLSTAITSGFFVGRETINSIPCAHYAFRQKGIDWQIWIAEGDKAYPQKIVITTTDDPSMPQYMAYLTWNPDATFASSDFTYTPSADASKISVVNLADASAKK